MAFEGFLKKSSSSSGSRMEIPEDPALPKVVIGQQTDSGRFAGYSHDDLDSFEQSSAEDRVPGVVPCADSDDPRQPADDCWWPLCRAGGPRHLRLNSLFTGGVNIVTQAHLMDRVTTAAANHHNSKNSSACSIQGCDSNIYKNQHGDDVLPCDCSFKICAECFVDAVTNGTYGYGNAIWPDDGGDAAADDDDDDGHGNGGHGDPKELFNKPWRPLTRKLKIPAALLSPYRLLILVRLVALALFLAWRITHMNTDAVWLWGMSVVCELLFSFSWLLDQLPKLCPVNRTADLSGLREKFKTPTPNNPTGKSDLPRIDVSVSTADPVKEPVLVTANTILSILAADYPVEKLTCYVSDDGGALLTFEAMAEAASFANLWVPFCRKHNIEPKNPESYFNLKRDPCKKKVGADLICEGQEADEARIRRVEGLDQWIPRYDSPPLGDVQRARGDSGCRTAKGGDSGCRTAKGGDSEGDLDGRRHALTWYLDSAVERPFPRRPCRDHTGDGEGRGRARATRRQ